MSQFAGIQSLNTIGTALGGLVNIIWSGAPSTATTSSSYQAQIYQAMQGTQQAAMQQGLLAQQYQGLPPMHPLAGPNPYTPYAGQIAGQAPPQPSGTAPLGFNRFVNASDLLEEFVRFAKGLGLKRRQFLDLPIELFIQWLVVRAAEVDGERRPDDVPDPKARILALPAPKSLWGSRCLDCGRFVPEKQALIGIVFCSGQHMDRYRARFA